MVAFDILNTKKADLALTKSKWKDEWEASVCESPDVARDEFFIRSGRQAFDLMEEISNDVEDSSWIDLLVLELSRFTPYYQLGLEENKSYKKLKVKTDYLGDVFCKGQNYIGNTDVKAIQKAYTYAIGTITGNRKKVAAAAVATLAVTAATVAVQLLLVACMRCRTKPHKRGGFGCSTLPHFSTGTKMKLNAPEFHLSFDYQSSFVSLLCRHVSQCIATSVFRIKYKATWKCPDIRFIE